MSDLFHIYPKRYTYTQLTGNVIPSGALIQLTGVSGQLFLGTGGYNPIPIITTDSIDTLNNKTLNQPKLLNSFIYKDDGTILTRLVGVTNALTYVAFNNAIISGTPIIAPLGSGAQDIKLRGAGTSGLPLLGYTNSEAPVNAILNGKNILSSTHPSLTDGWQEYRVDLKGWYTYDSSYGEFVSNNDYELDAGTSSTNYSGYLRGIGANQFADANAYPISHNARLTEISWASTTSSVVGKLEIRTGTVPVYSTNTINSTNYSYGVESISNVTINSGSKLSVYFSGTPGIYAPFVRVFYKKRAL